MTGNSADKPAVLVAAARAAARNAYARYSGYGVGAALLLDDDRIITGCNLENASFGMTLCAEAVALGTANAAGALRRVIAIAVAGGSRAADGTISGDGICHPCGRCRQMIYEVACLTGHDIPVWCAAAEGDIIETHSIRELLPHGFGPQHLPEGE